MCRHEPESEPMARAARRQPQPKRPKEKMYIRYLAGHSEQRRHPEDTQDLPNYQWVDWVTPTVIGRRLRESFWVDIVRSGKHM